MSKFEKKPAPRRPIRRHKNPTFDFEGIKPGDSLWVSTELAKHPSNIATLFAYYLTRGRYLVMKEEKNGRKGHRLYFIK